MLDDETTEQSSDSNSEAQTAADAQTPANAEMPPPEQQSEQQSAEPQQVTESQQVDQPAPKRRRRAASRPAGAPALAAAFEAPTDGADTGEDEPSMVVAVKSSASVVALFQPPPDVEALPARRKRAVPKATSSDSGDESVQEREAARDGSGAASTDDVADEEEDQLDDASTDDDDAADDGTGPRKRRRRRGGRRRRKPGQGAEEDNDSQGDGGAEGDGEDSDGDQSDSGGDDVGSGDDNGDGDAQDGAEDDEGGATTARRRRRRRRGPNAGSANEDDPPNTVIHVREGRDSGDRVTGVRGSTRLEAKKQRRREGREAGRRRAPILSEAEFLARRESVDRVMVVRQRNDRTQIAVLEDDVLSEHYVNRSESVSMLGNVYLGRVQNVLPSMEAAFVDIGRGRNAVLYAGEVNWDAAGLEGQPKRIELALKSGDPVLVQVTKDPVGQKGARLTSMISLPGRYLVYVPGGSMTGISRRLPDSERGRLKKLLRSTLPEDAGVIVRTAAEGATEEQIRRDVERLTEQWKRLSEKAGKVKAPELLHGETDLATRVVRDIFNEDFSSLIVSGDGAIDTIEDYIASVAPDLADRVHRWTKNEDVFAAHRIDEQLTKALDRKVWLPSGGSLVIDHTEAMTVVDVNTGRFTGQGGNLEETVTRNNLEAAEEVVRQLRLRDTGGIIVIDFIDMVLETNRDLVLRRLLECLSRDRTKHQVAEVTSLGLVQMTRKRIGQGLLETFSTVCECCNGRGVKVQMDPVDRGSGVDGTPVVARRRGRPAGPIPGAPIPPKAAEQMSEAPADDEQVTPSPGEEGEAVILDALTAEAEAEDALFDLAEAEAQAAEGELEEPVDDH